MGRIDRGRQSLEVAETASGLAAGDAAAIPLAPVNAVVHQDFVGEPQRTHRAQPQEQQRVGQRSRRRSEDPKVKIGQMAPDFKLPKLVLKNTEDGKAIANISEDTIALSSFKGKRPVFLIFSSYT